MARSAIVRAALLLAACVACSGLAQAASDNDAWASLVEMSSTTQPSEVQTTPGFRFMMTSVQSQLQTAMKQTAEASDLTSYMRVRDFVGQILARVELEQRLADIQAAQDVAVCEHNVRRQVRKVDNQASLTESFNNSLISTTNIIATFPGIIRSLTDTVTRENQKIAVERQRLDRIERERLAENFEYQSKRNKTRELLAAVKQLIDNLDRIPLQLIVRKRVLQPEVRPNIPSPIDAPVVAIRTNGTNSTSTNTTVIAPRFKSVDNADVFSMVDRLAADRMMDFDSKSTEALDREAQEAEHQLQSMNQERRAADDEVGQLLLAESDSEAESDESPLFLETEVKDMMAQPPAAPVVPPTVVLDNTPLVVEARQLQELRKMYQLLLTLRSQILRHLWFNKQTEKGDRQFYEVKKAESTALILSMELFANATIANRTVHAERLNNATRLVKDAQRGMNFNLPLLTIMRNQLATVTKACDDIKREIETQTTHRNQTMDTLKAIRAVLTERIENILNPPKQQPSNLTLGPISLNINSASSYPTCWALRVAGFAISGIYTLVDPERNNEKFLAYCDMRTDGGGWMLSFKQSNFASGGVAFDSKLFGAEPLLHQVFNASTTSSLIGYGKPKQMLFKSGVRGTWFITKSLETNYQYWRIEPTPRYCLFRKLHNVGDEFRLSPLWGTNVPMWDDANIQIMGVPHPDISAITIGRFTVVQQGPQCMEPNCAKERHGRYNGACQNGNQGIGNWMIFTR